ncbi:MAG: 2-amino-4-hydroxy-6-hydroxymethyldihydropteridine diphosphokinase [Ignavibacteriales bacterium]|nr:2-amino-4-hydroxy-6-hydroxymethyldihydropteridine diphosphokinase [Ignavibacteriales bacterium]
MDKIFLGLGSNKGDRLKNLQNSIREIAQNDKCKIIKCSSVYESKPFGNKDQDNFYNCVIEIETLYGVLDLYYNLRTIEVKLGREEIYDKWSPREIDIDILFYNNLIYKSEILTVPHKDIMNRDFVLVPLVEIANDFIHPILNIKLSEIDLSLIGKYIIRKLNDRLI